MELLTYFFREQELLNTLYRSISIDNLTNNERKEIERDSHRVEKSQRREDWCRAEVFVHLRVRDEADHGGKDRHRHANSKDSISNGQ